MSEYNKVDDTYNKFVNADGAMSSMFPLIYPDLVENCNKGVPVIPVRERTMNSLYGEIGLRDKNVHVENSQ